MWLQTTLLLLAQAILTQATTTLIADLSVGGIKGNVTFTQANPGEQVMVTINMAGPNAAQASTWQLHTFRLNYDVIDRCDTSQLGPRILNSVSGSASNGNQNVAGVELSDIDSIEGRSIVFLNTNNDPVGCATVESADEYVTARATFRQKVLGQITFRQLKASASSLTRVTLDLYWDGSESSAGDLQWRIVRGQDTNGCTQVASSYNPKSATGTCNRNNHASCAVGDLQDKLGAVGVGVTMGTSRKTEVDLNLPLSGVDSVLGMTVQLLDSSSGQPTPRACAHISAYMAQIGVATFDNDGVTGTITVTQPSPLDPTTTTISLNNLRSLAGKYYLSKYPVPQRTSKDQTLCSTYNICEYFDPFAVVYDDDTPAAGVGTEDMYAVGDLGMKYGLLDNSDSKLETYTDFNLPLFGYNSVMGRSILIHYNLPNDTRWVCSTIHDTAALTSVLATFTFPVIGHVLLQQRTGDPEADTSIYYRLDYGDGSTEATSNHAWDVHGNKVGPDMLDDDLDARCMSAGNISNPQQVSSTNYDSQCQHSTPLRCKMGDLTNKHKAINIRSDDEPDVGFFTDVSLPLQGPHSVVGKSLVIHVPEGGSQSLACATLRMVNPMVARVGHWGTGMDYGSVTFTQNVGVVQAPTTIDLNLKDLTAYSTVLYSIKTSLCPNPGGVYNPFEVSGSGSTKDAIPTGDLTAKFGPLAGGSALSLTKMDPSLDLWGPRSVLGRGFTLTASGSSLGCADVTPKAGPGGKLLQAEAVFSGVVQGKIMLMQYVVDKNGAMPPTTVVVDLHKTSGEQTEAHTWHTHAFTVGDDAEADTGRCASTAGHYNPFKVNVKSNYSECHPANPLRCELGDQSKKLGTYDMGSGPKVANDVYLPLFGPYGVVGRSFVVHTANKGAPRLACTDIYPVGLADSMIMSVNPPAFDKADMVQAIANATNIQTYDVTVKVLRKHSGCIDTRVYFLGMDAKKNADKFIDIASPESDEGARLLGDYKSQPKCGTGTAGVVLASVSLLLACLVMGRLSV